MVGDLGFLDQVLGEVELLALCLEYGHIFVQYTIRKILLPEAYDMQ